MRSGAAGDNFRALRHIAEPLVDETLLPVRHSLSLVTGIP
jgi:hypothetical protein